VVVAVSRDAVLLVVASSEMEVPMVGSRGAEVLEVGSAEVEEGRSVVVLSS
jgi:hypothetical protein